MRYVLSSAVVTGPGSYDYRLITPEQVRPWLEAGPFDSRIGYQETADALEEITGSRVAVNRTAHRMAPGDEALVFRLAPPAGAQRPEDRVKGRLTPAFVRKWCECGILKVTDGGPSRTPTLPARVVAGVLALVLGGKAAHIRERLSGGGGKRPPPSRESTVRGLERQAGQLRHDMEELLRLKESLPAGREVDAAVVGELAAWATDWRLGVGDLEEYLGAVGHPAAGELSDVANDDLLGATKLILERSGAR